MKKHLRYFMVVFPNHVSYIKLESELPFSVAEAKASIKEGHSDAKEIKHIKHAVWLNHFANNIS